MNDPVLTLLAAIIVALLALGAFGAAGRSRVRPFVGWGVVGLAGLGALLALLSLLLDDESVALALPLGPPGAALQLAFDPLSACFALLLFLPATVASLFAFGTAPRGSGVPAALPVCLAGLALAVLAGDGTTLALGLGVSGAALWAMGPAEGDRARTVLLALTLAAGAVSVAAITVLLPPGEAPAFAAIRAAAAPPPPAVLFLALLGPGALAGLAPLHAWLMPAHRAASPIGAALLSGAVVPVAIYVLLRLLLDLAGIPPLWWCLPPLLLGAVSIAVGGLRATQEAELDGALAAGTLRHTGLVFVALGTALAGRAADLPNVVALAFGAAVLLALSQALCGTLMLLAGGAMRQAAATSRLDRLGGLVHRMPQCSGCLLAGLFGVTALPPGLGFAAMWLLLQALLALPRAGGLPLSLLFILLAATLGLAAALSIAAALRLVGVVCLGRPRMPRTEGATEVGGVARIALLVLAALGVLAGILAGPTLHVLADAPLRALSGSGLDSRATLLGLLPGASSRGYAALPLAFALALIGAATFSLRRRLAPPAAAPNGRAWDGGFAAPFARLHFADPTTQTTGAGFTPFPPLPASPLRLPVWPHLRRLRPRAPIVILVIVAVWLLLCAWAGVT